MVGSLLEALFLRANFFQGMSLELRLSDIGDDFKGGADLVGGQEVEALGDKLFEVRDGGQD